MSDQILDALRLPWPTDWGQIYGRPESPIVEVGFGNASYLTRLALDNPDSNVIGLEISNHALDKAAFKIHKAGIQNIRLIRARAFMFFWLTCADSSIQSIHINFPDPWPKAAHKDRRLVNRRFLDLVAARLETHGMIQIATDDADYASSINSGLLKSPYFEKAGDEVAWRTFLPKVRTKYELKAIRDGRVSHHLVWRRNDVTTRNEIPMLEELNMPHVIISTPLPLMEIGHLYEPVNYTDGQVSVRFVDFFHSVRYDQAVVDTYIAEGDLEQRVLLTIKGKSNNRYLVTMRETGFPRPTPATHTAIQRLAEMIVSMHAKAKIERHNLRRAANIQ
ncbi:MAG: tRNA (guanosine(46)-N7)-methyltransferase TrmB [Candidatus Promineifilaceae bacterium]